MLIKKMPIIFYLNKNIYLDYMFLNKIKNKKPREVYTRGLFGCGWFLSS